MYYSNFIFIIVSRKYQKFCKIRIIYSQYILHEISQTFNYFIINIYLHQKHPIYPLLYTIYIYIYSKFVQISKKKKIRQIASTSSRTRFSACVPQLRGNYIGDPVGAGRPYRGLASLNSCISQLADARSHVPRSRPRIRQNQSFLTRTKPPCSRSARIQRVGVHWMEREGNGGKRENRFTYREEEGQRLFERARLNETRIRKTGSQCHADDPLPPPPPTWYSFFLSIALTAVPMEGKRLRNARPKYQSTCALSDARRGDLRI